MSAATYIGCTVVDQKDTPYSGYTAAQMAMVMVERYGQIDGSHHKTWVLDQVARILKGSPITFSKREWTDHEPEYDIEVGASPEYNEWVVAMRDPDEDGEDQYDYDEGIAP